MSIKDLMKQAHMQGQAQASQVVTPTPKTVTPTPIPTPVVEPKVNKTPVRKGKATRTQSEDLPTGVQQIARDDVPVTSYGVKPVATNFNCYNKELFEWLRNFSSNNQFSGGVPITKSQLIEIALDVVMYDLGINPIGYESQQELREDIQNKIKGL